MKAISTRFFVAVMFAAAMIVQAQAKTHSNSIIVESPSDLPEMAQRNSEAMYLHDTNDGRTLLYLEQNEGRTLAILDVTDPSSIRAVGQVSFDAKAPYDFVRPAGDTDALLEYRDHSGFAVIDLKKNKHPVLVATPELQGPSRAEALGRDSLLVASAAVPSAPPADPAYKVVDFSNPAKPSTLANIQGVRERLERRETGTLFLLGSNGLTVVRRPRVEEDYRVQQAQQMQP